MGIVAGLMDAANWLAANWLVLAIIPAAQVAHELVHFAVARYYGVEAVIVVRLRTPLRVVYDADGLSVAQRSAIGLAPTLAGLTAGCAAAIVAWPSSLSPGHVIVGLAWLLFTIPSQSDREPLIEWLGPEEPIDEPMRSFIIGFGMMAMAGWVGVLPLPANIVPLFAYAIILGSGAYLALAFWEHGLPTSAVK